MGFKHYAHVKWVLARCKQFPLRGTNLNALIVLWKKIGEAVLWRNHFKNYLSALLEDITVSVVIITRSPWLGIHVRYIVRRDVPVKRRPAEKNEKCHHLPAGLKLSRKLLLSTWWLPSYISREENKRKIEVVNSQASAVRTWQLAAKLAGFGRRIKRPADTLARFQAVGSANRPGTFL